MIHLTAILFLGFDCAVTQAKNTSVLRNKTVVTTSERCPFLNYIEQIEKERLLKTG